MFCLADGTRNGQKEHSVVRLMAQNSQHLSNLCTFLYKREPINYNFRVTFPGCIYMLFLHLIQASGTEEGSSATEIGIQFPKGTVAR